MWRRVTSSESAHRVQQQDRGGRALPFEGKAWQLLTSLPLQAHWSEPGHLATCS